MSHAPDLAGVATSLARRWELGELQPLTRNGPTSWLATARTDEGVEVVLKVARRHDEAEHEADGLRAWAGVGAAQVYADWSDDLTCALLLERCRPGDELADRPPAEQDEVISTLLQRLWIEPAAGHRFRPLAQMCAGWADGAEGAAHRTLDPGLARAGLDLFRSLPLDHVPAVLLATDLHAHNVLRAEREPWLVIDPKPYIGDATYDPVQHLLNDPARMQRDPGGFADQMADRCGLDRQRLRTWLFARCVVETGSFPGWIAEAARALAP